MNLAFAIFGVLLHTPVLGAEIASIRDLPDNPAVGSEKYDTCSIVKPCVDADFYFCGSNGYCYHKPVFPIQGREWAGYVVVTVLMALCNVAGIGGGAIDQPIVQIFFKFQIKQAIAISSMVILMAACARYIYTMPQRHP